MSGTTAGTTTTAEYRDFDWSYEGAAQMHSYVLPAIVNLLDAPPGRVLDVGCGNGYLAGQLAGRGYEVTGVDPSDSGLEMARRNFPSVRFEPIAAERDVLKRLRAEPFDAVVSTEVVEHLYAPDDWAAGCLAALRPGGLLLCSTPYHGWLKNTVLAASGKLPHHLMPLKVGGHIKFFDRAALERLLREAGFEPVDFRGTGRLPYLWKSMVVAARRPAGS